MNPQTISNLRLLNQQIVKPGFTTAKEVVDWMGAMQAQDFNMSKWAIGTRLPGSTEKLIEDAVSNGEIIRTHALRPTWHFVTPKDIYWILELSASRIKTATRSRDEHLGLNGKIFRKSNSLFQKLLTGNNHLTREELTLSLQTIGIAPGDNNISHILLHAELDGIICSGKVKSGKPTYALLSERAPKIKSLSRTEALAKLAGKYFNSHGPATIKDFAWWSGLSLKDATLGLEADKSHFISEKSGDQTFWFSSTSGTLSPGKNSVYLLPAFDEFIISYTDRTASLPFVNHTKAVSNNGVFRPTIVVNGNVTGIWRRMVKKEKVILETELFEKQTRAVKDGIVKAALGYGMFLGKEVEVR